MLNEVLVIHDMKIHTSEHKVHNMRAYLESQINAINDPSRDLPSKTSTIPGTMNFTLTVKQEEHQELQHPTLLCVQQPFKVKFSALRQNFKIHKPHKFGRSLNSTLYKNTHRLKPARTVDYHHSYLLNEQKKPQQLTPTDKLDSCWTVKSIKQN